MAEPQPLVDSPKKRVEKLLDQVLAQPYRKKQATEANAVNGDKNKRRKSISGAVNWGYYSFSFIIFPFVVVFN